MLSGICIPHQGKYKISLRIQIVYVVDALCPIYNTVHILIGHYHNFMANMSSADVLVTGSHSSPVPDTANVVRITLKMGGNCGQLSGSVLEINNSV